MKNGQGIFDKTACLGNHGEKEAQLILRQVMEGIANLHENGVCDIKPTSWRTKRCLNVARTS